MTKLLMHQHTERLLGAYSEAPTHALLLVGVAGSGKGSLARHLAEQALDLEDKPFADYAYGMRVAPEKAGGSIGIEAIRSLEQFLALKVPRNAVLNRGVIIEHADTMTPEAQNALLKTLEEPPVGTIIILTAAHEKALLPTIISRVQTIPVRRPEKDKVINHFSKAFSGKSIDQIYAISAGLPGLMQALLEEDEHPLLQATNTARTLLQQTTYERLLHVESLAKDKASASDVTYILQQMAHVSLQSSTGVAAKRWQTVLGASYEAAEGLRSNAQPKLVLTNLMLHL